MYRDLVYRPEEESYGTRDLVFRPGVDKSFAEVLPYLPPRTHTPLNPNSGSPYDIIRERRPSSPINNEEPLPYWKRPGPGSGGGFVEEKPRDPGISEIPTTYDPQISSDFLRKIENADRAAKAFLDLFMLSKGLVAGLPEPMSQEEFQFEVHKRMDRNKPSVQDVLRDKFGIGSFREGINRGIFPGAPQVPGI